MEGIISIYTLLPLEGRNQAATALNRCCTEIHDMLDVDAILRHLIQHSMLTPPQIEQLQSKDVSATRAVKIDYLLRWIPQKGSKALPKFIKCLRLSDEGTAGAHCQLADILEKRSQSTKPGEYCLY